MQEANLDAHKPIYFGEVGVRLFLWFVFYRLYCFGIPMNACMILNVRLLPPNRFDKVTPLSRGPVGFRPWRQYWTHGHRLHWLQCKAVKQIRDSQSPKAFSCSRSWQQEDSNASKWNINSCENQQLNNIFCYHISPSFRNWNDGVPPTQKSSTNLNQANRRRGPGTGSAHTCASTVHQLHSPQASYYREPWLLSANHRRCCSSWQTSTDRFTFSQLRRKARWPGMWERSAAAPRQKAGQKDACRRCCRPTDMRQFPRVAARCQPRRGGWRWGPPEAAAARRQRLEKKNKQISTRK